MEAPAHDLGFFEGLLKHKPIKSVLIKQLSLLDSLTLIRFAHTSPKLADIVKSNEIWLPRLQDIYKVKWYEPSKDQPGMYMTTLYLAYFPSLYDAFIFLTTRKPHAWHDRGLVAAVQDWNFAIESDISAEEKHDLTLRLQKIIVSEHIFLWTREIGSTEGLQGTKKRLEPTLDNPWFSERNKLHLSLVPRLGYWFRISMDRKDMSVVKTHKEPPVVHLFNYSVGFSIQIYSDATRYFVFKGGEFVPLDRKFSGPNIELMLRDDLLRTMIKYSQKKELTYVRGQIAEDWNASIFLGNAFSVYCYRLHVEKSSWWRDTFLLVCTLGYVKYHDVKPGQLEFTIEACLTCGKTATMKCSGCNRAAYCSEACGQHGWDHGLHNQVCNKL